MSIPPEAGPTGMIKMLHATPVAIGAICFTRFTI
jgi:hypothetical protein